MDEDTRAEFVAIRREIREDVHAIRGKLQVCQSGVDRLKWESQNMKEVVERIDLAVQSQRTTVDDVKSSITVFNTEQKSRDKFMTIFLTIVGITATVAPILYDIWKHKP